jgi:hypothetical protein
MKKRKIKNTEVAENTEMLSKISIGSTCNKLMP